MKIAITSNQPSLDANVDQRFGRAKYILIVDTETMAFESIDNASNVNAFKGAGIQTATMVSEKGAEALLTGFCGPNAFNVLTAAKVKVINDVSGIVRDCVQNYIQGKYTVADKANVNGHW